MDWNDYRKEINDAGFSPDAPRRAALRALAEQDGKERITMKSARKPLRAGLIAACVAVVLIVSATAAAISWNKNIQDDLGIGEEPIPEYHEYENSAVLVTVCSGPRLDAYFSLPAVEEDRELTLRELSILPQPDSRSPITTLVDRLDYDADTQTALVRVTVMSDQLPQADAVELSMSWQEEPGEDLFAGAFALPTDENGAPMGLEDYVDDIYTHVLPQYEHLYGPVRVPVAESELLTASCNVPLDCGTVTEIRVGAGFVEFCMEPSLPESEDTPAATRARVQAITAALADAAVTFTDGRTETISALPSPWSAPWVYASGDPTSCRVQHMLSQVIDLREVTAITLAGNTIPLG